MRHYETIFIADPDLAPDVQESLFEKSRVLISGNEGELVDFDEWGNRRLAYEIRKKQRGHYVRLDYCGSGRTVRELENAFRIDERVLKFMTVFIGDNADLEQLKEAAAAVRQKSESVAEPAAETAANEAGVSNTGDDTPEVGSPEVGSPEVGSPEVDTPEVGFPEVGSDISETGSSGVGTDDENTDSGRAL